MTETSTVTHHLDRRRPQARHRRPRAPGLRGQDRRRRRDPRPRPAHLPAATTARGDTTVVRRGRGRLAAHRRPRLARRRRLPLDHRPQEGHHDHRGRQEPHAREPRERPQALALDLPGGHARRPPPVPGRADHARPGGDRPLRARARAPRGRRSLSREPKVVELIQGELDRVNENYARVEQIKKFFILDHDLSQETGELTPTLKVKRNVVNEKYASEFDALYEAS